MGRIMQIYAQLNLGTTNVLAISIHVSRVVGLLAESSNIAKITLNA